MKQRDTAQKKASASKSPDNWRIFKDIRNRVNNRLKREKNTWETNQFDEKGNDPSKLWRSIKSWLQWETTSPPTQLFYEGHLINTQGSLLQ